MPSIEQDNEMKQDEVVAVHAISEKDFVQIGRHDDDDDFSDEEDKDFQTTSQHLSHELSNRHTEKQLENNGVIKGKRTSNLSSLLAAPSASLEHHMVADKLSHDFKEAPPKPQRTSNLSSVLAAPANDLAKHLNQDKLSRALQEERKSGLEMSQHNKGVSNKLLSTQNQLNMQMTKDVVSHSLTAEKRKSDLGNMSSLLAAPAKELEKSMHKDAVHQGLTKRSSQSELIDRGVLPSNKIAPMLAAPAKELEKHIVTDKLSVATRHKKAELEGKPSAATADAQAQAAQTGTIRDRVLEYQKQAPQAQSKVTLDPKSGGMSLKDRMKSYIQTATGGGGASKE